MTSTRKFTPEAKNRNTYRAWKPTCPCCLGPALTRSEEALLAALYTAPAWPSVTELARVTGAAEKSIRRSVGTHPELFNVRRQPGHYTRLSLTPQGERTAQMLAGRIGIAAE